MKTLASFRLSAKSAFPYWDRLCAYRQVCINTCAGRCILGRVTGVSPFRRVINVKCADGTMAGVPYRHDYLLTVGIRRDGDHDSVVIIAKPSGSENREFEVRFPVESDAQDHLRGFLTP